MSRRGDYLTRVSRIRRALTEPETRTVLHCSGFGEQYIPDPPKPPAPKRCKGCGAPDALADGFCRWCDRGAT